MAKNSSIYGCDPDGGASAIAEQAIAKHKMVMDEAAKVGGDDESSARDITGNLGEAKP